MNAVCNMVIYLSPGSKTNGDIYYSYCTFICKGGLTINEAKIILGGSFDQCQFIGDKVSFMRWVMLFFKHRKKLLNGNFLT